MIERTDPLKVLTIVGTRPELVRLALVIKKLDIYTNHRLIHTGQNFSESLNKLFFKDLDIRKPDYQFNAAKDSNSAIQTISKVLVKTEEVLLLERPDAVLILGDTNSSLAALAVKKQKIPLFHMESGNRCFDARVPEEMNRRIVDHISDINLCYSQIARDYLVREGISPDRIIKIGTPLNEVLHHFKPQIEKSIILESLQLTRQGYFLFSMHREENVDCRENHYKIIEILNCIASTFNIPVVVSLHPRTKERLFDKKPTLNSLVRLCEPFGFLDYIKLQISAKTVLSDSGSITEESSILKFPALNLRETHERPEGFEESTVMMVGLNIKRIMHALRICDDIYMCKERIPHTVADYLSPNVSDKVVKIIESYTQFINREVWKRA